MHVFDVEEVPKIGKRAVVRNARDCTTCRECLESFPGQENFDKKEMKKRQKGSEMNGRRRVWCWARPKTTSSSPSRVWARSRPGSEKESAVWI